MVRWLRSMPQYEVGHLDRVARIEAELARRPGLFVAGAAYRGVGMADCVRQGAEAAGRVLDHLAGAPAATPGAADEQEREAISWRS